MLIPDSVDIAFMQLASADASIRKLGAQALSRLRPLHRIVEVQHAFLVEENEGVAKWLALALGEIGDPRSLRILQGRLSKLPDNDLLSSFMRFSLTSGGTKRAGQVNGVLGSPENLVP